MRWRNVVFTVLAVTIAGLIAMVASAQVSSDLIKGATAATTVQPTVPAVLAPAAQPIKYLVVSHGGRFAARDGKPALVLPSTNDYLIVEGRGYRIPAADRRAFATVVEGSVIPLPAHWRQWDAWSSVPFCDAFFSRTNGDYTAVYRTAYVFDR